MKYLVAGLGNIGAEYELTRHNIGFLTLDQLADDQEVEFTLERHAYYSSFKHKSREIHMIKPTTYMNLSGKAINYWMQQLKINPKNLLVVTDDIALPFGKLRMRAKGSAAGHNGLKNIEQVLGHNAYARLRFGVGDNFPKGRQVDYVLSRFSATEFDELPSYILRATQMILGFCTLGIDRTMNQFNQ